MELEITAAQKVPSSKKSIVLHPTDQGNAKVVLVKHYISPSGRKKQKLKPVFTEVHNAPVKAYKRKSFELVGAKEAEEQYTSVKRRRSVQLGECERTLKTSAPVVQREGKPQHCIIGDNVSDSDTQRSRSSGINDLREQSKKNCQLTRDITPSQTHVNGRLDFDRDDQQFGDWKNGHDCDKDTVLLPEDWLDKRYNSDLLGSDMLREFDEHKSFFSVSEQETPQVKRNGKCKSLFATYHLSKVHKSIIDEM